MNIIFDQVKRKNLYNRIMKSNQYANSKEPKNIGILRTHSKLSHKESWNKYFIPLLKNDFTVEDIKDRDLICYLIKEIDHMLYLGKPLYINASFSDYDDLLSFRSQTELDSYYNKRNTKQEKRLINQLIRYFKRLRKNLQRQLNHI